VPSLLLLLLFLRPILYTFLDREGSRVLGLRCWCWEGLFFFLLGLVVSGASKSGGALLVFCLLVVVPATALLLARRLWAVITLSVLLGIVTTWAGLLTAYSADLPSNPTIIGFSCLILMSVAIVRAIFVKLITRR
jgi:ABC-type Mn2+/Zn2+ transport system permease subunit